jgi:hypothetical protein
MKGVLPTEFTEFFEFQLVSRLLLILGGGIIFTFALSAIQTHDYAHKSLSYTSNPVSKPGELRRTPPITETYFYNNQVLVLLAPLVTIFDRAARAA